MRRKAGIGKGKKHDFTKDVHKFPSPNKYKIADFVETNKVKRKGKTFGLSRHEVKVNNWQIASSGFPGVGKYNHKS